MANPDGTTLSGTRVHPIWSVDRQDWVRMDELAVGEHLQTRLGPIPIASIEHLIDPQPVYNLEVNGQHVYEITELGILVHNNWILCERARLLAKKDLNEQDLARLKELEDTIELARNLQNGETTPKKLKREGFSEEKIEELRELGKQLTAAHDRMKIIDQIDGSKRALKNALDEAAEALNLYGSECSEYEEAMKKLREAEEHLASLMDAFNKLRRQDHGDGD